MHLNVYCQNINNIRPQVRSHNLEVCYGTASSFVSMIPVFFNYLSDYEKTRAHRFRYESDYNCYVSVHALLRIELSKLLKTNVESIRIEESENGKPRTSGMDLPFSLSRTKDLFAFVIGHGNYFLGIDIEQIKPGIDFTNISRNYFSIKEQQLILCFDNNADKNRTFYEIWTRKEALLKAIGIGINTELSEIQVLEGGNHINIEGVKINADAFKITTITNSRAIISVASSTDFSTRFKDLSL